MGLVVGSVARARLKSQAPTLAVDCADVVAIREATGDRLACPDDPELLVCSNVRPGFRYDGCRELGPIAGAVLLARGQPMSVFHSSAEDFAALSGIGPALARKLLDARSDHALCSPLDLEKVPGIGAKKAQALSIHLRYDDPRCVSTPR
jgi:hypothetical protein